MSSSSPAGSVSGAVLATALAACSLAAWAWPAAGERLALTPGNTVLGNGDAWHVLTAHFVEASPLRLVLALAAVLGLAARAERGGHPPARVLAATLIGAAAAGALESALGHASYMRTTDDRAFYAPRAGAGGLVAALAVLCWQAYGAAPLAPDVAPWLSANLAPALALAAVAVAQLGSGARARGGGGGVAGAASSTPGGAAGAPAAAAAVFFAESSANTDATLALFTALFVWAQARFALPLSPGGAPGDARDEFELLAAAPAALRVPLRPLEKLASTVLLPAGRALARAAGVYALLGAAGGVAGGGFATLPTHAAGAAGGGAGAGAGGAAGAAGAAAAAAAAAAAGQRIDVHLHVHSRSLALAGGAPGAPGTPSTGIYVADPVAERRREKALLSLDKRLAELRGKMRGTGALPAGAAPTRT